MKARAKKVFDIRVLVVIIGVLLSFVLHELFHIIMHWGHITAVEFMPDHGALVQITSIVPLGYDLQLEEIAAYTITILTMLVTIIVTWKIHDAKDTRTVEQILSY